MTRGAVWFVIPSLQGTCTPCFLPTYTGASGHFSAGIISIISPSPVDIESLPWAKEPGSGTGSIVYGTKRHGLHGAEVGFVRLNLTRHSRNHLREEPWFRSNVEAASTFSRERGEGWALAHQGYVFEAIPSYHEGRLWWAKALPTRHALRGKGSICVHLRNLRIHYHGAPLSQRFFEGV